MNALSWMIYLADALNDVDGLAFALAVICGILAFMIGFCTFMNKVSPIFEDGALPSTKWFVITAVAGAIICALVPSKETIYAIAASEMGEEVIKSETAGKAMKALDAWLDQQIAKSSPAASK